MDKNQVNIKYTTNILHFQVEGRKQNLPSPKQQKKQDKSCDLSCLVEQAIEISNSFIDDYRIVCEFKFAWTVHL